MFYGGKKISSKTVRQIKNGDTESPPEKKTTKKRRNITKKVINEVVAVDFCG